MKTYSIVGNNPELIDKIFQEKGYIRDDINPNFVISYGGDGTLLKSEHEYPGIPKLFLRNSLIGNLGFSESNENVIEKFFSDTLTVNKYFKIEANIKDRKIIAVNEFSLKNKNPRYSIRFDVCVNDKKILNHIIGDGLIAATPIGSTGYYRSITRSTFELGIGLAFNNSHEHFNHMVLKEDSIIKVVILRGPAFCYVDNHDEEMSLEVGDEILIKKSEEFLNMFSEK
ncbi:NAD(+)/NADH kinase [Candidatus Parcubacteria bacterium]|nr:NAD(+)/NADH kinase [Candidatus Parcubacteria bacterium]